MRQTENTPSDIDGDASGVASQTSTTTRTPTTDPDLLGDLAANPDSGRIDEFARLYEPVLRRYARQAQRRLRFGLCESDQDDLVQEAFLAVRHALPQFRYDPAKGKFRNYLSLTIRNLAFRFLKRADTTRPTSPAAIESLAEAKGQNAGGDDEERELMLAIWSVAYALVVAKRNFSPNTLAIFKSHALDGIPAEQAAEEFKTSANAVYQIKDRILRAVRAEIDSARRPDGGLAELHEELLRSADAATGRRDK